MAITRLNKTQLDKKINFITKYVDANNAADGSGVDPNANVAQKNVATMSSEIHKDINIQINRDLVTRKISEMYGQGMADEYIRQIEEHEIYVHDESSLFPYCASITMYPYLLNGTKPLGGASGPPTHLKSFCGSFTNLLFLVSAQFAGAVATVEFLMYFDHFAKISYGENYLDEYASEITDFFQQVVYTVNEPAVARNYQSVFWNISLFDENYFNSMFGDFYFPTGEKPSYDSLDRLQRFFMKWFNKERERDVLTFPVITAAMLSDGSEPKDKRFADFVAEELSEGNGFFIYMSDSVDSLSSCCRLQNELQDNTFSYSLGAGGVSTGSINVITLNLNRFVQKDGCPLSSQVDKLHAYQHAYYSVIKGQFLDRGMLPLYDLGFIDMSRQFLTIGINGAVEAAEYLGIKVGVNDEYKEFIDKILKTINEKNKAFRERTGLKANTEFVPAENLGVKNAQWDKKDGLVVPRDCYNSYFYVVEDEDTSVIDKFVLHGKDFTRYLDGGSALHLNLRELLDKKQYLQLLNIMARVGCPYLGTNTPSTKCGSCGYVGKSPRKKCIKCGSDDVVWATRVIGYLKEIENYSEGRRTEAGGRFYHV